MAFYLTRAILIVEPCPFQEVVQKVVSEQWTKKQSSRSSCVVLCFVKFLQWKKVSYYLTCMPLDNGRKPSIQRNPTQTWGELVNAAHKHLLAGGLEPRISLLSAAFIWKAKDTNFTIVTCWVAKHGLPVCRVL